MNIKFSNIRLTHIIAFFSGFSLMVVELTASRIVAPVIGSSLYTWTSVIGVILLGGSIGNFIGGVIIDKRPSKKTLSTIIYCASIFVLVIPYFAKFGPFLSQINQPPLIINILICVMLFFIPTSLIGMIYPGLLKLSQPTIEHIGVSAGSFSGIWSLGSIVGTFLTGFFLIGYIGNSASCLLIAIILLALASLLRYNRFFFSSIVIFAAASIFYAMSASSDHTIFTKESAYYQIRVVDSAKPYNVPSRLLFLDIDSHSIEAKDGSDLPNYTNIYPIFKAFNPNIKSFVIIGGGSYTLSKKITSYYPTAKVTTVEIDPAVSEVARNYFDAGKYPIQTINEDGRNFMVSSKESYDVIFSDAYNSLLSIPWHLATNEFNQAAYNHLTEQGIYAVNFISALKGENSYFFQSMLKTFSQTFPNHVTIAYSTDPEKIQNIILIGFKSKNMITADQDVENFFSSRGDSPAPFIVMPNADGLIAEQAQFLTDDFAPTEKLMLPLIKNSYHKIVTNYYTYGH